MNLAVAILAAGASSRMGRPKLTLPWGPLTVLEHLLRQWAAAGAEQVAVVWHPENQALARELERLHISAASRIPNPAPELGMFGSVLCAARWDGWKSSVSHIALALGDQPQIKTETLRCLAAFAAEHPRSICQASRHGRPKHPVLLPRETVDHLAHSRHPHLRAFLEENSESRAFMASDDSGLDFDLDYPEDYERAVKLFMS